VGIEAEVVLHGAEEAHREDVVDSEAWEENDQSLIVLDLPNRKRGEYICQL
jgi:hypothetical protein